MGADAVHVLDLGLDASPDTTLWAQAATEMRIAVSKDEDFSTSPPVPAIPVLCSGCGLANCRTDALLARFSLAWAGIQQAFTGGHRIVILP